MPTLWPYPDSLDALAASAEHHQLLFEDDSIRVIDTKIGPRERTAVHTHRYPGILYIVVAGTFLRHDDAGNLITDSRKKPPQVAPSAFRVAAMPPHSVENIGDTLIHLVNVEFKAEREA